MAAIPAADILPQAAEATARALEMPSVHRASLAQLAMLHDEARETALLANLLGRAPYAAAALGGLALIAAGMSFAHVSVAPLVTWLVLIAAGVGAIVRVYSQTIKAPFERVPLRAFSKDLSAIMFYAGFAWGAGAFLALPAEVSPPVLLLFSAGTCAAMAALLRARDQALIFLAPTAGLCALAPLLRGEATGMGVLIACGIVAGLVYAADRLFSPAPLPQIAEIPAN